MPRQPWWEILSTLQPRALSQPRVLRLSRSPLHRQTRWITPLSPKPFSLTVTQATPVFTWTPPTAITYGTALSNTQLNATASVPGSFAYTPALGNVPTAGTDTLSVTFTPTDTTNYTTVTKTVQLKVTKATPVVTWTSPAAINYGTPPSGTHSKR